MNQWPRMRALVFCLLPVSWIASAGDAAAGAPFHKSRSHVCPQCNTCCELKVEKEDEDRYCWDVECEEICIPRVVFPWQKSRCNPCVHNGADVKTVRVLKKRDYTCPVCTYTWTPKERVCQTRTSCGPACGCAQCGSAPTGIDMGLTTLTDEPVAPAPPAPVPVRVETAPMPQAY